MAPIISRGSDLELSYASPVILKGKGADPECVERYSRKTTKPRALNDEAGKLNAPDGRNGRNRGCSDDIRDFTSDGFSNEDLRVGGPYLCSLPDEYIPPRCLEGFVEVHYLVIGQVDNIMRKHLVQLQEVAYTGRRSIFNPEPQPIPSTMVVGTRGKFDN